MWFILSIVIIYALFIKMYKGKNKLQDGQVQK